MRFMKIGKQKGATSIYEVAPLLCVLSLPLFNQIPDLRGKFCVVLIGAAFAGLDKGKECFCCCQQIAIDRLCSGRAQQVSNIGKANNDAFFGLDHLTVFAGTETGDGTMASAMV